MALHDQIMKGLLDGAILGLISQGETYGYEILERLIDNDFPEINDGSIYPVLLRLNKKGYVTTRMVKSDNGGPKRKYYSITDSGMTELVIFKKKWIALNNGISNLMRSVEDVK
ncbi:PadR family transcriptional regulator [Macrococcus hajekii]|uniref:PadR family transcriptional regulator n=1 Tax=Macrococcus hajekii TaxID=198482 RepID=A0A4R6BM64_9STAP|nr:PadR family transcriptional regulator [Macrococcus hajekii]TDM02798.1 PadR family transcriptional regulator [Macrococcus hajekii]GGB03971.1 PadR family transcriptional regulator [Macrococcus hajekii]